MGYHATFQSRTSRLNRVNRIGGQGDSRAGARLRADARGRHGCVPQELGPALDRAAGKVVPPHLKRKRAANLAAPSAPRDDRPLLLVFGLRFHRLPDGIQSVVPGRLPVRHDMGAVGGIAALLVHYPSAAETERLGEFLGDGLICVVQDTGLFCIV
jgi:hypothetical protein